MKVETSNSLEFVDLPPEVQKTIEEYEAAGFEFYPFVLPQDTVLNYLHENHNEERRISPPKKGESPHRLYALSFKNVNPEQAATNPEFDYENPRLVDLRSYYKNKSIYRNGYLGMGKSIDFSTSPFSDEYSGDFEKTVGMILITKIPENSPYYEKCLSRPEHHQYYDVPTTEDLTECFDHCQKDIEHATKERKNNQVKITENKSENESKKLKNKLLSVFRRHFSS